MHVKEGVSIWRPTPNAMDYLVEVVSGSCFVQAHDYSNQRKVDKEPIRDIK